MQLRVLRGRRKWGGQRAVEGVQVIRAKKAVGGWLRPGVPCGAKVELRGASMYDFIATLTEFVLPRLRDFDGIVLPFASSNQKIPSPCRAVGFFPQIEVNVDSYSKLFGMHIHFVTNATGVGAQDRARALVSGFQIPSLGSSVFL
ncbi:ribosomal protein L5 domain-containing protein [Cyathus striatus]|nr:ribosomal protein L5 domain-containing protein [Cyathus striatus]